MPDEYILTGESMNWATGELDDLVELSFDLRPRHAEDRAVHVNVLAAGQLGMEAGPQLQQGSDPPVQLTVPSGGLGHP